MKLSIQSRYYLISFITAAIFWLIFILLDIDFINVTFFIMSYIWHFTLLVPGIRENLLKRKIKYSFLSIVVKVNYYLQLFLPTEKIPYGASVVRAISPFLFSSVLLIAGGIGNLLFTLLGSLVFEAIYLVMKVRRDDPEIPPAIPTEENVHE
jgi:hypothetical protein